MRAERRAIVHIGHRKTGTTFIQNHFHANRAALLNAGVLYPFEEANHSFGLSGIFRQDHAEQAPTPRDRYASDPERARTELDRELHASEWHTLVLSGEVLTGFSRRELEAFSDWLDRHVAHVRIVFVVRDPVEWAVSAAQQHLKTRGDIDAVFDRPEAAHWANIIKRYRAAFGRRAVAVLEYEALAAVRERFAAQFALSAGLGADIAAIVQGDGTTVNESLSMEAALMLGRYNVRVPELQDGRRNPARSGTESRAFAGLPGHKFDLPQTTRLKAHAQSRQDVAFLAREFGITRYSYPASDVPPSRYTEEVSVEFLDALTDRLVSLQADALATRLLLDRQRLRNKGDRAGAAAALEAVATRFPTDERVIRAVAAREAAKERQG
ncbi:hypothetical protein [Sphingomonas sp. IC4-52]|uniref:hypothetical protein n=1 Tax=Sphingomonas sp. IC4-52 TaxID=2887202 RepID=UPI001D11B298|nr:hypothetical protein [Sphingomonas sp. IC4-52]MCC2980305.1 hypothetical protein [Sphingomonas sp. IC4-52]